MRPSAHPSAKRTPQRMKRTPQRIEIRVLLEIAVAVGGVVSRGVAGDHQHRILCDKNEGEREKGLGVPTLRPRKSSRSGSHGRLFTEELVLRLYDVIIDIFRHRNPNFPIQILLKPILIYIYY